MTQSVRFILKSHAVVTTLLGFTLCHPQSPLHLATYLNLTHVVSELMEKGASLGLQDRNGNTALHVACQQGQPEMASEMTRHVSPSKLAPILETQNWKGKQTSCLSDLFFFFFSSEICHLKLRFCDYLQSVSWSEFDALIWENWSF